MLAIYNITDSFGRTGQVRLRNDGKLERRLCGQRIWRPIAHVDISIFSEEDVQESLKATEGIVKVMRQRG